MDTLLEEIQTFKKWADHYPIYQRSGEWECDYGNWAIIYTEFEKFSNMNIWNGEMLTEQQIDNLLYIIARDNECEHLVEVLLENLRLARHLAQHAVKTSHSDAKWQLAKCISAIPDMAIDELLYQLSFDRSYYVQRICMMESAKRQSVWTKEMIEFSWQTADEYQRISALWSLYWINSEDLEEYLAVAEKSDSVYLRENVQEIRHERQQSTPA